MPGIPAPIEQAVQMVWRMFCDPCDAPFTVWVDTLRPAARTAILAWFTFDISNMVTEWLRPRVKVKGFRNRRHIGGGRKADRDPFWRDARGVLALDPGATVGERLPGATMLQSRQVGHRSFTLWAIFGQIQLALQYFMVIDIVADFLIDWMSGLWQTEFCRAGGDAVLYASLDSFQITGIFGWSPVVWSTTEKERRLTFWNSVGVSQSVGPGVVSAHLPCRHDSGGGADAFARLRVRCLSGDRAGYTAVSEFTDQGLPTGDLNVQFDVGIGELWVAETFVDGIWTFGPGTFYLHAPGDLPQ